MQGKFVSICPVCNTILVISWGRHETYIIEKSSNPGKLLSVAKVCEKFPVACLLDKVPL